MTPSSATMEKRGSDRAPRAGSGNRPSARRGRTGRPPAIALNMAPMIDMTFLLFSFVLVTSTFERPEGILASDMPRQGGESVVALPLSPIVIRIQQAGSGEQDYRIQVDRFTNPPTSFAELPDFLRAVQREPGFDVETPVVIVADEDVRWDHVVSCWNAVLLGGCKNIAFAAP